MIPPTTDFSALRQREFSRLDRTGTIYADYTGSALYPESLVASHAKSLAETVLGNPHSDSGPSLASTALLRQAKVRTLQLLNADPKEYDVVFTANASGAMRILAEAFPFERGSRFVLTADNHNSVNGLRLTAQRDHAQILYIPLTDELAAEDPAADLLPVHSPSLFAYPAQSNFSGVQHPLDWISRAQAAGYRVLLDAAAYLPTHKLSLREHPADFVALSFYKLFGYPTGIGALVVRHDALALLRRRYFAGGTVDFVSIQNHMERAKFGSEAFEDGTSNFLAMSAVCDGLDWLNAIRIEEIQRHTNLLTGRFLAGLSVLNEQIRVYGPGPGTSRGSTIAFNLYSGRHVVPFEQVEAAARAERIALRGGCFCNPGAAERALNLPAELARACFQQPAFSIPKFRDCLGGAAVGALRASFGAANSVADVDRVLEFLRMAAMWTAPAVAHPFTGSAKDGSYV